MKILLVNKFYYPNRGAEKYFLYLEQLLRSRGHNVRVFAMASDRNLPSPDCRYFTSEIDLRTDDRFKMLKVAGKIIYNPEAKNKISNLLDDFRPDIVHCHNIYHQLSPSILDACREKRVPVVMHLHDYKLICPNYRLYTQGRACERCNGHRFWQCAAHRCVEGNLAKSCLATIEMYAHHNFLHIYEKGIKLFIAPSKFMKDICIKFGWPENKFHLLENITPPSISLSSPTKNYFLYLGALEEEKGIETFIRAGSQSDKECWIAGTGSVETHLKNFAASLGCKVKFLGKLEGQALSQTLNESLAVVIPSIWPENMPLVAIEAMSAGKAVIASRIGGLPELIKDGETGYTFEPGNAEELSVIMKNLTEEKALNMGLKAKESRVQYDEEGHYQELIRIYEEAIKK